MKLYVVLTMIFILLTGCASAPPNAPCDNFGNNCNPKIKINQWTN